MTWRRILCPTDFSEPARASMRHAVDLAIATGADEVALLHVIDLPTLSFPEGILLSSPGLMDELTRTAEATLSALRQEAEARVTAGHARVTITTHRKLGTPTTEIVAFARDGGFGLIVIGTHGRSGVEHALLGSVAERVARRASCPTLTVRPAAGP